MSMLKSEDRSTYWI